jgi:hypothetical protein
MVAMLEGRWRTVMVVTNCQGWKLECRMELMLEVIREVLNRSWS